MCDCRPKIYSGLALVTLTLLLLGLARWTGRTRPTLSRRQKRQLLDKQEYVRWAEGRRHCRRY